MSTPTTETIRPWAKYTSLLIFVLVLAAMLFPFVEMVSTALRSRSSLFTFPPRRFPEELAWRNFVDVWSYVPLARHFGNSLIIAFGATLLNAAAAIPAAFALARFSFPGRRSFLYIVVATQMFSPVVLLIAFFKMMTGFGLVNTYSSLIIINATVTLPFTIWLMTAYFSTIHKEIEEAAILDGAGRLRILIDHFVPLSAPGIVTAMTFTFILAWGEFLFALTFINDPSMRPLTTGIFSFVGRSEIQWNFLMAASLLATVPVFVLFLFIQRQLVSGLTAGAVK